MITSDELIAQQAARRALTPLDEMVQRALKVGEVYSLSDTVKAIFLGQKVTTRYFL